MTWERFPAEWPGLLAEVRAALPADARTALNVMLYRDDVPHVEVGLLTDAAAEPGGRVVASTLPGGTVATTTLRGGYDALPAAHQAVHEWCAAQGHRLAGLRWEVYGHWYEDPARVETEVAWLLA
jgi:effector-binding domain-containing protein